LLQIARIKGELLLQFATGLAAIPSNSSFKINRVGKRRDHTAQMNIAVCSSGLPNTCGSTARTKKGTSLVMQFRLFAAG
jgi:hypothetical protein